ncbi:MAG: hypothetical protein AAGF92_16590 [Myxococcota bacterium]
MTTLAALDGGTYYHQRTLREPPFSHFFDATIYVRDAPNADFEQFDILFLPSRLNADLLEPLASRFVDFMGGGGTLVCMGETHPERWLPGVDATPVDTNFWWWLDPSADLGVRLTGAGELPKYLDREALTWHLHGSFSLRPGQVSLVEAEGACIMFEEPRGAGRLIATTLDPCYHHGSYFMPATTRCLEGLLPWLKALPTRK